MHRKVEADQGKDAFNGDALVIGKVVFMILLHQRRGAKHGEKCVHQAGRLEPESVKRSAYGKDKRLSTGKDRVEHPVFLYNALQRVFDTGNLGHCGYCSAKIGVILPKE